MPTGQPLPLFDNRVVRFWCGALVLLYAIALGSAVLHNYIPHAVNFSMMWAAGRLAAEGRASAVYDWTAIQGAQPFTTVWEAYFYPPTFLLPLSLLARLPYWAATTVWIVATLIVYLAGIRTVLRGRTAVLAALSTPVILFNILSGETGLLTAGLIAAALTCLDERPIASGVMIGLLSFKPQLGVMLPPFLAVTGRWRVFAGATGTVGVLFGATGLVLGASVIAAWVHSMPVASDCYLAHAHLTCWREWGDLVSVFGMLRAAGVGGLAAWAVHIPVALLAAAAALWVAAGPASRDVKAASLLIAGILVTPYVLPYDLSMLTVASAFLVRDGLRNGFTTKEAVLLAAVHACPLGYMVCWALLASFGAATSAFGMGPLMCLGMALVIGSRLARQTAIAAPANQLSCEVLQLPTP